MTLPFYGAGGRPLSVIMLVMAVALMAYSTIYQNGAAALQSKASDIAAPVLSTLSQPALWISDSISNASGVTALKAENMRLAQENARLREWYQAALALRAENQSLKTLLNVQQEPDSSFITARVIADRGQSFVKSLLVPVGADNGVKDGHAVTTQDGLVGRIINVGDNAARVLLLTDINARTPVKVRGTEDRVIMAGTNTDTPTITRMGEGVRLSPGDELITSGDGGIFPANLTVGTLHKTQEGEWAVQLAADFSRLSHVQIMDYGLDNRLHEALLTSDLTSGQ